MSSTITHDDIKAALQRLKEKDPGLRPLLKKAYGYALFPSVGKAAAVVGGAYGRGEVFEHGKRIGYATLSQLTLGVQLGGDTFAELIVFENKQALDRFKQGKVHFAANASAVLVRAGAAASARYEKGVSVFVVTDGGMMLELGIGGQKFKFKPAGPHREEPREQEQEEDDGSASATGGIGSALTGLAKSHPIAASVAAVGLVGGIAWLATRMLRHAAPSFASGESGDQTDDEGQQEQEDDQDDNDEEKESAGRIGRLFGRSR